MSNSATGVHWDAIILGTGMGGATLGLALAQSGLRVLFCEKGRSHLAGNQVLAGQYAELFMPPGSDPSDYPDLLARSGRATEPILDRSHRRARSFTPFVGAGTGGSSALYGMALERFYPEDFTPRRNFPEADDSSLPEAWPISYEQLRPFYQAAERLFRVRGEPDPRRAQHLDPLLPPPPISPPSGELFQFLKDKGLHPYRLPSGCETVADCPGCQGFLCNKDCKNDAARICLLPATRQHGAELLDQCQVVRLETSGRKVSAVVCRRENETLTLSGKTVVLACGALETPAVLLRSKSPDWPNGLANRSGLVGRNLMRHFVDLYAVFVNTRDGLESGRKELAFNDFYLGQHKLGTVQAFGSLPPAEVLVDELQRDLRGGAMGWLAAPFSLAKPLIRTLLRQRLSRALILASIAEDLPFPTNRVSPNETGNGVAIEYRLSPGERNRIRAFRTQLTRALSPYRWMLVKQAENNQRIAHACGTCRFGLDPATSVLDEHNRAHDLDNLYVVDASFFPSSGGINPALTIAANALRLASHLKR